MVTSFTGLNTVGGATECQEEYPWDDEPMVECIEVKQVEKLVKVWEKVAD